MRPQLSEQERLLLQEMQTKADTYLKAGRFDVAERTVKSYMANEALLPDALTLLGLVRSRQGQVAEAVEQFVAALKIDERQLDAKLSLVVSLCDSSQYDHAIEFYEQAVDQLKKVPELVSDAIAECHINTAKAYEEADMLAEAMAEYQKALSYQEYMVARLSLAGIYVRLGYLDKAERELEQCLQQGFDSADISACYGLIQLKRRRLPSAEEHFQNALRLDPAHLCARTYLAHVKSLM